jgi:hypothetical protein
LALQCRAAAARPHSTQIAHGCWFVGSPCCTQPPAPTTEAEHSATVRPLPHSGTSDSAFAAHACPFTVLPGCAGLVGAHCCAATALAFSAGCRKRLRWRLYLPCRASVRKPARRIRSHSCHPLLLLVETTQPACCPLRLKPRPFYHTHQGLRPAICCSTPRHWPCGLVGPPRRPRCLARARLPGRRYPSACRASF